MKEVFKYNLFKVISLLLTVLTPLITAFQCSDFIIYDNNASISMAGIIAILIAALFLKNKIAENFKLPSPFVIATVLFVIIIVVESVLFPVKMICLSVMVSCGIDELTFKRIYKRIELLLPKEAEAYKHLGFICCRTETIKEHSNE